MTDFKVTDEAVQTALSACSEHFTGPDSAMRAAIEAALPVMFEEVLYAHPELIDRAIEAHKQDQALRFINAWNDGTDTRMVPLFRLKEPK